jgi:hypothetical protein
MGHGIVLKGIVKYYGRGKNIPHTFGHTGRYGYFAISSNNLELILGI